MAILAINFTENGRSKCCFILAILNWICIALSVCILGIGLYIKFAVAEFTHLVEKYDGDTLPMYLVAVGGMLVLSNAGGGILIFISGTPSKRESVRNYLFGYVILALLLDICILVGSVLCFAHIQHLDASFKNGIIKAIGQYKDKPAIKLEVDKLQMSYKCCGNDKYTDWFHVSWISNEFLDMQAASVVNNLQNGKLVNDNAPFSCCNPKSPRPCIHHNVHDNSRHYNYDYRTGVTLYSEGCRKVLMSYLGDWLLRNTGIVIIAIFVLQTSVVIACRFLESSINNALESGDAEADAMGWLIGTPDKPKPESEEVKEEAEPLLNPQSPQPDDTFDEFDNTLVQQQPSGSLAQQPSGALYGLPRDPTYENLPRGSQVGMTQMLGRNSPYENPPRDSQVGMVQSPNSQHRMRRGSSQAFSQRGNQTSQSAIALQQQQQSFHSVTPGQQYSPQAQMAGQFSPQAHQMAGQFSPQAQQMAGQYSPQAQQGAAAAGQRAMSLARAGSSRRGSATQSYHGPDNWA